MIEDLAARAAFVWGGPVDVDDWQLDDADEMARFAEEAVERLLPADEHGDTGIAGAMRQAVSVQILTDDPPAAWEAAQRMHDAGMEREHIFRQIAMVFLAALRAVLDRGAESADDGGNGTGGFDHEAYARALTLLPLPEAADLERQALELVRARPWIDVDELADELVALVDHPDDDELIVDMVDRVIEHLTDDFAPLALDLDDGLVHVPSLIADRVLTRRLNWSEATSGRLLNGTFDLALLRRFDDRLRAEDGTPISSTMVEPGQLVLMFPEDTLAGLSEGDLVTVRTDEQGTVRIAASDHDATPDPDVVAAARHAYDRSLEQVRLPVSAEDLMLGVLRRAPEAFDRPGAPLQEIARAAGLEVRGNLAAHDEATWREGARDERSRRAFSLAADTEALAVLRVLTLVEALAGWAPGEVAVVDAVEAHRLLADGELLVPLADLLCFPVDDHLPHPDPWPFVEVLTDAARRDPERATAGWLRAVVLEREGRLDEAEVALAEAHRLDPDSAEVIDRLAWYASDRGDAYRAASLWRRLEGDGSVAIDLANVEEAAAWSDAPDRSVGRNEPCWCGSGRKFKQCHLGQAVVPPLPERVGWLCRKAVAFLERRGGEPYQLAAEMASARAVDPTDRRQLARAFEDPLTIDLVLTEEGWFISFLEERGALLPDDERELAEAWAGVRRTVFEIEEVRPGEGLTVLDIRSGDRFDVRERTLSRAVQPGELFCARAVPDGESHQFIGGVFEVEHGDEFDLLGVLEQEDGFAVAEWVAECEEIRRGR